MKGTTGETRRTVAATPCCEATSSFPTLNGAQFPDWENGMSPLQDRLQNSLAARSGHAGSRQRGFSLLEMMISMSIILILAGVTFYGLQPALKFARVNSAYDTTLMLLRNSRQQAIAQRTRYIVTFAAPGTITVQTWAYAAPPLVSPPPVLVRTVTLPADIQFAVQGGMPSTAATVPDGFGTGGTAIDFDQGAGLGSQPFVMFMPDGSSQDTQGNFYGGGNFNSGIVYLGRPNELASMRAITVFGTTGRIRGWQLVQRAGVWTWFQQ
jgi:prepilin-type N-terminal cleavage/methylation domain-containing protein